MASDQTLPLPPLPAPSNPDQILLHHTIPTAPLLLPEDDPTPPAARKLPIKRRSPPRPSPSPSSSGPASSGGGGADPALKQAGLPSDQTPFKFQRIWSESDELRFLQGLLGCGAQGLVFPRDLNVFYDRFSESMPQPYTRSQLSEKLRRLKNKYRSVSTRVAKGLDPARLAPHDRDVLHLCSRLWDPANAATSPFAAATPGSSGNKRRRANPPVQGGGGGVAPLDLPAPSGGDSSYNGISSSTLGGGGAFPDEMHLEQESGHHLFFDEGAALIPADCSLVDGIGLEQADTIAAFANIADNGVATDVPSFIENNNNMLLGNNNNNNNDMIVGNNNNSMIDNGNGSCKVIQPRTNEHRLASAMLDIFEDCVREAKAEGTISDANAEESELAKRWRQQRIDEIDVLSRRLRLLIEDATAAGH